MDTHLVNISFVIAPKFIFNFKIMVLGINIGIFIPSKLILNRFFGHRISVTTNIHSSKNGTNF
jgi:hypothetical protein